MKELILLITIFSISFAKIYVSYDLTANWEISIDENDYYYGGSIDDDYDTGALTVGYETNPKNNIAYGVSYDIVALDADGSDHQFLNIYGKYFYPISPTISLFGTGGYNLPQGDIDDADGGLSYSFGLSMSNGVGVSYSFNNVSEGQDGGGDIELTTSRLSVSYSF